MLYDAANWMPYRVILVFPHYGAIWYEQKKRHKINWHQKSIIQLQLHYGNIVLVHD